VSAREAIEADLLREIGRWRAQKPSRDGFTLISVIRPFVTNFSALGEKVERVRYWAEANRAESGRVGQIVHHILSILNEGSK